jgi:hypothetical protein
MDNREARIGALTRYILLLRQEENRLNGVQGSPRANRQDRESAEAGLRVTALKISDADQELRGLETRRHQR